MDLRIFGILLLLVSGLLPFAYSRPPKPSEKSTSNLESKAAKPRLPKPSISRIIGGDTASPGEFPYLVSIQYWDPSEQEFVPTCGGAILSPSVIVSAAHCTLAAPAGLFRVVAGEHNLALREGTEQYRVVSQVVVHNAFDELTFTDDVGLYILDSPLVYNRWVGPIRIGGPIEEELQLVGKLASVAGWGTDSDPEFGLEEGKSFKTDELKKLSIPIYGNEVCADIYDDSFESQKMLCAGNLEGGEDTCAGDSGGPLVLQDPEFGPYVVGLVSFGPGGVSCGSPGYLGVYTRVSSYVDWLNYVIRFLGVDEDK